MARLPTGMGQFAGSARREFAEVQGMSHAARSARTTVQNSVRGFLLGCGFRSPKGLSPKPSFEPFAGVLVWSMFGQGPSKLGELWSGEREKCPSRKGVSCAKGAALGYS